MDSAHDIIHKINTAGYAAINCWNPQLSTEEATTHLGSILDIDKLLPNSGIPNIQTLKPRRTSSELMNQYSGTYGLGEFPLHSDLAHWQVPPRYLLLRCIVGSHDVVTTLLPHSTIFSTFGQKILKLSLVVARRKNRSQAICPLPVIFNHGGICGMRWDSLFLEPINSAAKKAYELFHAHSWGKQDIISTRLTKPGDTLIIDNWRMLHGRSSVPKISMDRNIQRIYLNNIGKPEHA